MSQVTVLESTDDSKQQILVATVHLYFHPKAPHIRIIQTAVCLRHIERVLAHYSQVGYQHCCAYVILLRLLYQWRGLCHH